MGRSLPNILLVVLDAARARNFGIYGHDADTTPFFDSFAENSTLYTQARSPSVWTLPSHASMFTGYHVPEHNVTSRGDKLAPGHSVWEDLQETYGYDTGVFANNYYLTADQHGLNRGFETVVTEIDDAVYPFEGGSPRTFRPESDGARRYVEYVRHARNEGGLLGGLANGALARTQARRPRWVPERFRKYRDNSRKYTEAFLNWQRGRDQWAACINVTDAHYPYLCAPECNRWGDEELLHIHDEFDRHQFDYYEGKQPLWRNRAMEALYDGCLHQSDRSLKHLITTLDDRDVLDDTLVVVTADHGEAFGEQGEVRSDFHHLSHITGIHEVLLHVPLLVRRPGQTNGKRITKAASLTRFPDLVRDALEQESEEADEVFVPAGPVIAAMDANARIGYHLDETTDPVLDFEEEIDVDPDLLQGYGRAVYETRDGFVRKFVGWDSESRVADVYDSRTAVANDESTIAADKIGQTFGPLTDASVRVGGESVEKQKQIDQLEHLGYL